MFFVWPLKKLNDKSLFVFQIQKIKHKLNFKNVSMQPENALRWTLKGQIIFNNKYKFINDTSYII